jgi:hypothetical protein
MKNKKAESPGMGPVNSTGIKMITIILMTFVISMVVSVGTVVIYAKYVDETLYVSLHEKTHIQVMKDLADGLITVKEAKKRTQQSMEDLKAMIDSKKGITLNSEALIGYNVPEYHHLKK